MIDALRSNNDILNLHQPEKCEATVFKTIVIGIQNLQKVFEEEMIKKIILTNSKTNLDVTKANSRINAGWLIQETVELMQTKAYLNLNQDFYVHLLISECASGYFKNKCLENYEHILQLALEEKARVQEEESRVQEEEARILDRIKCRKDVIHSNCIVV